MASARVLVLGGGFGGLACAHELRRLVPEVAVAVVDRSPSFVVGATQTWVMLGRRREEEVARSRERLRRAGIEYVQAEVTAIDPSRRTATTTGGQLEGDFLVVALGTELDLDVVPGLAEAADTFYTLEGAARLRERLASLVSGRLVLLIPSVPFKCPPAPYEAAILLHDFFQRRGLRSAVAIEVDTVEPAPMPTAGPTMGALIRGELEKRGIAFFPGRQPERVDAASQTIRFVDGSETSYDLLISVPRHRAPAVACEAGLAGEEGWIPVDPRSLETAYQAVFAVGDVTVVSLPGRYVPERPLVLPKAGVFAEAEGKVVAARIAARIRGEEPKAEFGGEGFCYLELGGEEAVRADGSFFAPPHPTVVVREPSREQYEDKLRWVEEVLEAYLDGREG
ncbi:MAG: pyridine nucleotide-disulfide oxidoreductase [Thermoleophilia bacterium]